MRTNGKLTRNAFTLLEIIVVLVVIGVMSAMIIPKLGSRQQLEFNLTVDRVNDAVLMFAHRVSTSNQPAGLRYDRDAHRLELLSKFEDNGDYYWEPDPLAKPVLLPSWLDKDAITIFVDGEVTDTTQWPVTTTPGETRPLIEVSIFWEQHSALISLPSHAMGPTIWIDGVGIEPLVPIDLDAQGRGREEW